MTDDRRQIIIRCSKEEKALLQELAEGQKKSVNQYVVDLWTGEDDSREEKNDSNTDSTSDSTVISILISQMEQKDEQIRTLQRLIDQEQQLNLAKQKEKMMIEEDTRKGKWWKFWSE